ncbi:hypothetical protein EX30DRAFT_365838 [Ascodesmis nigricans]|uniref:Mitochondrial outer membrane transport complex Sam37/metaxin N-terminal domain-containing protein n=1 Tax=Ascodesmis nigricans TaxID=341454 RepID=A0A4S2MNT1_9PEZI|nr:hypothetical protein EX30DRAFT_365838 [Ascodesmis nigricans]
MPSATRCPTTDRKYFGGVRESANHHTTTITITTTPRPSFLPPHPQPHMLELHVYGPFQGLPSIDAQCLAAIAYLQVTLPRGSYTVIASSNPWLSPSRSLPALRHNTRWLTTLPSIASYLAHLQSTDTTLSASPFSFAGRAPSPPSTDAFTTYILTHGQHLLDLSLFCSLPNYPKVRSAYSTICGFPDRYLLPPRLLSAAEARIRDLGITVPIPSLSPSSSTTASSLDPSPPAATPGEAALRTAAAASENRKTALKAPATRIRLTTLFSTFLDTLESQLSHERHILHTADPTLADCAAVGVLSLLLFPDLPDDFAAREMRKRRRLVAYVHDLRTRLLGAPVLDVLAVMRGEERSAIPWGRVERGDWEWLLRGEWIDSPLRGWFGINPVPEPDEDEEREGEEEDWEERKMRRRARVARRRQWWGSVATIAVGVVGFAGFLVWSGMGRVVTGETVVEVEQGGVRGRGN